MTIALRTIAIIGVTGNVGKPTTAHLVEAAKQGKIKLIILHREGKTAGFESSTNVELKTIDLDGPQENIEKAVKGVNVFISTIAGNGLQGEMRVIEALAKSPDFVVYIPPKLSIPWSKEDLEDPVLGPFLNVESGYSKALELGLPMTVLYTGVFDWTFFDAGLLLAPIKQNTMMLNEKLSRNKVPITTMAHIAQAITSIVTTEPLEPIKNKEYVAVTAWPTGEELRSIYTSLHGQPTDVKQWTAEERETQRNDPTFYGPARVGYMDRWESGKWDYEANGRVFIEESTGEGLEQIARRFF